MVRDGQNKLGNHPESHVPTAIRHELPAYNEEILPQEANDDGFRLGIM